MSRRTLVVLVDDLDGAEGDDVREVTLAIDGVTYDLDLSAANRAALDDALAPYVAAGRKRTSTRRKRTS